MKTQSVSFMLFTLLLLASSSANAQVSINTDGTAPDNSAMLDVKSNTKGLLIPRMTHAELNAISSPADGLIVYCTDCGTTGTGAFYGYVNGAWNLLLTCIPPSTPIAETHMPFETQIIWNWNTVAGATGYKWGIVNNYSAATDIGTDLTKTETGLICNTTYTRYIWAYNNCGNSAVTTLTQTTSACWVCGQPLTDSRDGKTYNTVLIGTQCWMAQNINIGTRTDGFDGQTNNSIFEKYCYNGLESNCDVYGGLYQWGETIQYLNGATNTTSWNPVPTGNIQGICPTGWHLPTDEEWTTLTIYTGDPSKAGGRIKEAGYAHWAIPNTYASNITGFTALPGGYREYDGFTYFLTYNAVFWSATEYSTYKARTRTLHFDNGGVFVNDNAKDYGFSVRCLKD